MKKNIKGQILNFVTISTNVSNYITQLIIIIYPLN